MIDLDRRLCPGRARRTERDRLREIAGLRGSAGLEAVGDAASGPGALAAWAGRTQRRPG